MVFVGINREESEYTISVFIAQTGWTHPVLMDQTASVYQLYQLDGSVSPFPLDYIIDRDGIIRYGLTDYDPWQMRVTLDLLLAQCDPVTDVTAYPSGNLVLLRWTSLSGGEYQIYSAATPDPLFPDNWNLDATVPDTENDSETWTDPAAPSLIRFYCIIHVCE